MSEDDYYEDADNIQIEPGGEVRRRPRPDIVAVRTASCPHLSTAGRLISISCGECGPLRLRYTPQ